MAHAISALCSSSLCLPFCRPQEESDTAPGIVQIQGGEFSWDASQERSALRDINIAAGPGSLTMVVGSVGCGKSSVLAALIRNMTCKCVTRAADACCFHAAVVLVLSVPRMLQTHRRSCSIPARTAFEPPSDGALHFIPQYCC